MECFSGADLALCVREFYKNGDLATVSHRKFCNIRNSVKKFEEAGSTLENTNLDEQVQRER